VSEEKRLAPGAVISFLNIYAKKVWEELLGTTPTRRKVRIVEFVSSKCPHCEKYVFNPESLYNRAIKICMAAGVDIERITYDTSTPTGLAAADEAGVKTVPRVFVNGREIPLKYLESENPKHLDILVRYVCALEAAGLPEVQREREEMMTWGETEYESSFF